MFIKPGPDPLNPGQPLLVRFLHTRRELLPEGEEVDTSDPQHGDYWHRRLAHGDVVEAEPPVPDAAPEEAREKVRKLEAAGEHPDEPAEHTA